MIIPESQVVRKSQSDMEELTAMVLNFSEF